VVVLGIGKIVNRLVHFHYSTAGTRRSYGRTVRVS